ncbi:hypothetical protein DV515_00019037, partial [Chloebia gouldiae]
MKFQEEKQSLESEVERVTGQFQEMQSRMRWEFQRGGIPIPRSSGAGSDPSGILSFRRQLMRSSAEKFRQVWMVNEEEAKALIREALEADRIIRVQQLGMPWEEPRLWFMDNVGPLGRRQEKRDAMQVATKLLEGGIREFLGIPGGIARQIPRIPWNSRWDRPADPENSGNEDRCVHTQKKKKKNSLEFTEAPMSRRSLGFPDGIVRESPASSWLIPRDIPAVFFPGFPGSNKQLSSQELCFPGIFVPGDSQSLGFCSQLPSLIFRDRVWKTGAGKERRAEKEGRKTRKRWRKEPHPGQAFPGKRSGKSWNGAGARDPGAAPDPGLGTLNVALPPLPGLFPKGFLLENKLLKPLREVVGPRNDIRQLRSVFEVSWDRISRDWAWNVQTWSWECSPGSGKDPGNPWSRFPIPKGIQRRAGIWGRAGGAGGREWNSQWERGAGIWGSWAGIPGWAGIPRESLA